MRFEHDQAVELQRKDVVEKVPLPVATERTSRESSFTRGLKEVLLSPPLVPPPLSQREGYLSISRSSGPLWRRTRQSDSSRAWISDGGRKNVLT